MRIAVLGAGITGLSTARVLRELGHDVLVHEHEVLSAAPDPVDGGWSLSVQDGNAENAPTLTLERFDHLVVVTAALDPGEPGDAWRSRIEAAGGRPSSSGAGPRWLPPTIRERLSDENGEILLHRGILAVEVPGLSFVGHEPSPLARLQAELGAVWLAAVLTGEVDLPGRDEVQEASDDPSPLRRIDAQLDDLGLTFGPAARFRQWLRQWFKPLDPAAYDGVVALLIEQLRTDPVLGGGTQAPVSDVTR